MKNSESCFETLLYTQLFSRVGFNLNSLQSSHKLYLQHFFEGRDNSYFIDTDRLTLNPYEKDVYPLIKLLKVVPEIEEKQPFIKKVISSFQSKKVKEDKINNIDFSFYFSPTFKKHILTSPIISYQKIAQHDIKPLTNCYLSQLQDNVKSIQLLLKKHDYFADTQLSFLFESILLTLQKDFHFNLKDFDNLYKLVTKLFKEINDVYRIKYFKNTDFLKKDISIFMPFVLEQFELLFKLLNDINNLFIHSQLYKTHVLLFIIEKSEQKKLSDKQRHYFLDQLYRLLNDFSYSEGFLSSLFETAKGIVQTSKDLANFIESKSSNQESIELYRDVIKLYDFFQEETLHFKSTFFDVLLRYLVTSYTIHNGEYRSISERFIFEAFERFAWHDMADSTIRHMASTLDELVPIINSFDSSLLELQDNSMTITEAQKERVVYLLLSLETVFTLLGMLLLFHFKMDAYLFQRRTLFALQKDIDQRFKTSFSSLLLQLFCLCLPPKSINELCAGMAELSSSKLTRELISSSVDIINHEQFHPSFKDSNDWWNSIFFINYWKTTSRQTLFSMPEKCWRLLLMDWSANELYYSPLLHQLLSYYKTHQKEKFIFDLLVYLIEKNTESLVSHNEDLLKVLYLKSLEYQLDHSGLSPYSIYFTVHLDNLREHLVLIDLIDSDDTILYSAILVTYLNRFFEDFINIAVTENDYVVMHIIEQLGYAVFVKNLFRLAELNTDLFEKYFSFFSSYVVTNHNFLDLFLTTFSKEHIDPKLYAALQLKIKELMTQGHSYTKYLAMKISDSVGFSDILKIDLKLPSKLMNHDVIADLSYFILIILQKSQEFLFDKTSLDKLEFQIKVRTVLTEKLDTTLLLLNESLANELTVILNYAEEGDQNCIKRIEKFRAIVIGSQHISLQQQILLYQWIFLISFAYFDSFSKWFSVDVLLFIPFHKKPILFNDLNVNIFTNYIIPTVMLSRRSDYVIYFLLLSIEDIKNNPERQSNLKFILSLLGSSLDFISSLDEREKVDLLELKQALKKLLDLLYQSFQRQDSIKESLVFELVELTKKLFSFCLIELDHDFFIWLKQEYLNLSDQNQLIDPLLNDFETVQHFLTWLKLSYNDLLYLNDDDFYSQCEAIKKNNFCILYLKSFSMMLLYKFVGLLLVRLRDSESKEHQSLLVYLLNTIFSTSFSFLEWKNSRLLREFIKDFFVNDQFNHFIHLFYFESTVDEQYQFFDFLALSSIFLKQQLLSLYQSGHLITDSKQQELMLSIIDNVIEKGLSINNGVVASKTYHLIDTLLSFNLTIANGRVSDLYQVESLAKQLLNDFVSGLDIIYLVQKSFYLLSFFVANEKDPTFKNLTLAERRETLFFSLELLCQHLQSVKRHPQVEESLIAVLDRSMFYFIQAWLHDYLRFNYSVESHNAQQASMTTLIIEHFDYREMLSEILPHFNKDLFVLTRLISLFAHDKSGRKDQILFYLAQEFLVLENFKGNELTTFFYKAIEYNYSPNTFIELFHLASSKEFILDLLLTDIGLCVFVFDDNNLFKFIKKESFLELGQQHEYVFCLFKLFYPDMASEAMFGELAEYTQDIRFDYFVNKNAKIKATDIESVSHCFAKLFVNTSPYIGPILTILYLNQPKLFWEIILNSKYDLISLFVEFLLRPNLYSHHLNNSLVFEWINHSAIKFYLQRKLNKKEFSYFIKDTSVSVIYFLGTLNDHYLSLITQKNLSDFIKFCFVTNQFMFLFDKVNYFIDTFSERLFTVVYEFEDAFARDRYYLLLFLSYLDEFSFYSVLQYIEKKYHLKKEKTLTLIVQLFLELGLHHRLVQLNLHIRPLLHKLDSELLESFNQYGVSHYVSYSEICYTSHLKFDEHIDILQNFNFLPSLISRNYQTDLANALSDHKESTYLLDLAVNNAHLFKYILLNKRFAIALRHAMAYGNFQSDYTLYHQIEKTVFQFNYFESLIFAFHYVQDLLLEDQKIELKSLFQSVVTKSILGEFNSSYSKEEFSKDFLILIGGPLQNVIDLDPLLNKVVTNLFSKEVPNDSSFNFLSFLVSFSSNKEIDLYQKEYVYKKIEASSRTSLGRQEIYVFFHYQHAIWDLNLFFEFINGWQTENSLYDVLFSNVTKSLDSIILNDTLDGLAHYIVSAPIEAVSVSQLDKLLAVTAFLIEKGYSKQLLLRWLKEKVVDCFDSSYASSWVHLFDITVLDDHSFLSLFNVLISKLSLDHLDSFFQPIRHHHLFFKLWATYLSFQDSHLFLSKMNFASDPVHLFMKHFINELIQTKSKRLFEFAQIHESHNMVLDYFFTLLYDDYFVHEKVEETVLLQQQSNPFILLIKQAIQLKEESFLRLFFRLLQHFFIPQKKPFSWFFNEIFELYRLNVSDFNFIELPEDNILDFMKLLAKAGLIDGQGFIFKELFYPIEKEKFKQFLMSESWTEKEELFYVDCYKIISQKVEQRQLVLKLLVEVVPELIVNKNDDDLLSNRSVGGYVFTNSVSLINIIFRFYKDSSFYKILLNELMFYIPLESKSLQLIYNQFSLLSDQLIVQFLLDPLLSVKSREMFCYGMLLFQKEEESFGYAKKWIYLILNSLMSEYKSNWLISVNHNNLVAHLEILLFFFFHFPEDFLQLLSETYSDLGQYDFFDFHQLYRCKLQMEIKWYNVLNESKSVLTQLEEVSNKLQDEGFTLFQILFSYRMMSVFDQAIYELYVQNLFDQFSNSAFIQNNDYDPRFLTLLNYMIPSKKVGFIEESFWTKIDYSAQFREWLAKENHIDDDDVCLLNHLTDLQSVTNIATLYLSFLDHGSGYYFKLMEDPDYLMVEAKNYFQHFFNELNQEKVLSRFELIQTVVLMRRLSGEFGYFKNMFIDIDLCIEFLNLFEKGEVMSLLSLKYTGLFKELFNSFVQFNEGDVSYTLIQKWLNKFGIYIQPEDFTDSFVKETDLTKLFDYLKLENVLNYNHKLVREFHSGFKLEVPSFAIQKNKKYLSAIHSILNDKRSTLLSIVKIQLFVGYLFDYKHGFNANNFIQLIDSIKEAEWYFIKVLLVQPIYHYKSLFDYIKVCIKKYDDRFELENSLHSFKKAAALIHSFNNDRKTALKRAFSVTMVKSRPTVTRLYELLDSLSTI